MVSATVKALSLLSGMMIMSTPPSLLHVMSAVTVKLDGAPAIKCMHSDITVQFTAYAYTCTHTDPQTHGHTDTDIHGDTYTYYNPSIVLHHHD